MQYTRNRYHTSIKIAYKLNILSSEISRLIPRSTLHRFSNTDYSGIFGIEFAGKLASNEKLLNELLQCQSALALSRGIIQIKNTIIRIKESSITGFQRIKEIVSVINDVKDKTGIYIALELFAISRSTYHSWSFQVKHQCFDSFIGKCVKRWPNQLSLSSVKKIRSFCEDERFKGWPLVSIAHYAKRTGILNISLNTWYKYAGLIGISKKPTRCMKKNRIGIRAVKPHQFWHADVTQFRTTDSIKAYIYFVVDNFSRAILSWRVSLKLSAETRLDSVKEAYDRHILNSSYDYGEDVQLIVDGGPENSNSIVDEYIKSPGISIKKIIAQQDIHFSNSIVEAVNKIVKYRSLYLQDIHDINSLQRHLEMFVPVYNNIRPHCSLKGLTPSEVLSGLRPDNPDDFKSVNLKADKSHNTIKPEITCTECAK